MRNLDDLTILGLLCLLVGVIIVVAVTVFPVSPSLAQSQPSPSVNISGVVATGNTFQQIQGSLTRRALTIQNNNTNGDNCWLFLGTTAAATKGTSILLAQGASYSRYYPLVPSDPLQITCASNSDTWYADYQ